jgi:hypothetical protein
VAVRNLWRHFERNLCSTGSIFIARGNERFVVLDRERNSVFIIFLICSERLSQEVRGGPRGRDLSWRFSIS